MKCRSCGSNLQPVVEGSPTEDLGSLQVDADGQLVASRCKPTEGLLSCGNCGDIYMNSPVTGLRRISRGEGDAVSMMSSVSEDPYAFVPEEDGSPFDFLMDQPSEDMLCLADELTEEDEEE